MAAALAGLAGCATVAPQPAPVYRAPPPDTTVFAYPLNNQSPQQQQQDHYQCGMWATQQTGFDPSAPGVPAYARVAVQGPPPGTGTAIGAVAGALLGAVLSNPWDRGAGAAFGALTGAMIGSASDAANAQANQQATREEAYQAQQAQRTLMAQAANYRRAVSACLAGRGYSVK